MRDNFEQNFVGTIRVLNEKPIIAELISNGKFMPVKLEIEPHFDHAVHEKFGDFRAVELFRVVVKVVEKDDFGHINEMARAVVHFNFEQITYHPSTDLAPVLVESKFKKLDAVI